MTNDKNRDDKGTRSKTPNVVWAPTGSIFYLFLLSNFNLDLFFSTLLATMTNNRQRWNDE
jgi:hypothetical protein